MLLNFYSFHVGYGAKHAITYANSLALAKDAFVLAVSDMKCRKIYYVNMCYDKCRRRQGLK